MYLDTKVIKINKKLLKGCGLVVKGGGLSIMRSNVQFLVETKMLDDFFLFVLVLVDRVT